MSKIPEISVFGEYKNPEDRVTAALLHILNRGGHDLVSQVFDDLDLPTNEVQVIPQSVQSLSRPDGEICCQCNYRIFIESKIVPGSINTKQLAAHCCLSKPAQCQYLIYLTPDNVRPAILPSFVFWFSWEDIIAKLLSSVVEDVILKFLIEQFILLVKHLVYDKCVRKYREDKNLEDKKSGDDTCEEPSNDDTVIVGGSWGKRIAQKYGFYTCQAGRYFRNVKYLAFYTGGKIEDVYEIAATPQDYVDIKSISPAYIGPKYFVDEEPYYNPADVRKFFKLRHVLTKSPAIINDKKDKNGNPCPFLRKQVYTSFARISKAKFTSDL